MTDQTPAKPMEKPLSKPILIVGLGLSLLLWVGDELQNLFAALGDLGSWLTYGLMAAGAGLWWWQRRPVVRTLAAPPAPLTEKHLQGAIAKVEATLALLQEENPAGVAPVWGDRLQALKSGAIADVSPWQLTLVGGPGTGKTTLAQGFSLDGWRIAEAAPTTAPVGGDVIALLTQGDITASEFDQIRHWQGQHQGVFVLLSQGDRFDALTREQLLVNLRQRVKALLPADCIFAVAAQPAAIRVHQEGEAAPHWEQPTPEVQTLGDHLLAQSAPTLHLARRWRLVQSSHRELREVLNQHRYRRALPLIEQYQALSAVAAFANPVPALDLLATGAITAQMVSDLGKIYRCTFTPTQAKAGAEAIGKILVQLGLVELSTQAITAILKSNTVTYIAGGAIQGMSAAYLTRIAGLGVVEYLQAYEGEALWQGDRLGAILQRAFQQNTHQIPALWQGLGGTLAAS